MKNNRIAQQLRNLSLTASLENDTAPAGEAVVKVELEEAQTTQAEAEGEDKDLTVKTVEVGERSDLETADTEVKGEIDAAETEGEGEIVAADTDVTDSTNLEVSTEGLKGAMKGFAIGTAGVILSPMTMGLSNGAVDAGQKMQRQRLANEINVIAKRLADLKNGDVEKAKKEGITVSEKDIEKVDAGTVVKSFVFGMILPFYSTYQGHKVEELQIELAGKITELKIAMASHGIATESDTSDAAVDAAAAFAEGAAGAAEAAAAASDTPAEVVADVAEVVEETVAEVAEDAGEAAAEVVEEAIEAPEETAAIDEADAEIDAIEGDIADGEAHAEEYEEAAATMESLIDALRDAQQSGGLTQQSARFYQIGFESIGVRLTGKPFTNSHGESAVPSLESFGGTGRRDHATQVSLESATEWLAKIWEVLKKTFQQIKEWVIKFFQAMFSQAERYKQRARKIKDAVSKLNSNSAGKNPTFVLPLSVASKIHINGEVSRWDVHDLAELTKLAGQRNQEGTRALIQLRQNVKTAIDNFSKGEGESDLVELLGSTLSTIGVLDGGDLRNSVFSETYSADGQEGFKTKTLPGGVTLVAINPASEEGLSKMIVSLLKGWRVIEIKEEVEVKAQVRTPTGAQILKIAGDVESILATIQKAQAEFKAEALDLVDVRIDPNLDEARAKQIQRFTKNYSRSVQNANAGTAKLFKYVLSTSGAYLDFAVAALRVHGVEMGAAGLAREGAAAVKSATDKTKATASAAKADIAGAASAIKDAVAPKAVAA